MTKLRLARLTSVSAVMAATVTTHYNTNTLNTINMSNTLIRETLIASSDEDMERLHASIVAGFDPDRNFVILMEKVRDNTGDPFLDERDSMVERILTKAILDKENTNLLCDKLHTSLLDLPEAVWQEFGDNWPSYRPSEIESIFKKMTDFLVDNGCRFNVMTGKQA